MESKTITILSRVMLFLCGMGLLGVLIVPLWKIELQAPQYPEGLKMLIFPNKLSGNIDIINGLNHYIGMKTLHSDDFPEFKILPGIIVLFATLCMMAAFIARRKWVNILCGLFVIFGIIAMIDFWRWEYDYGHNLNPDAAIIVPGMAYQPPLIGFKRLLNFGAYSMPAAGGWIFVTVGVVLLGIVVFEWRRGKKKMVQSTLAPLVIFGLFTCSLSSCNIRPQPIQVGKDNCEFCKMTISDNRFGAEIITKKSKVYKFDDEHCIMGFLNSQKVPRENIARVYFVNFSSPHELINVEQAHFLQSPGLKSPMGGNIAAFSDENSLAQLIPIYNGKKTSWEEMQK